MPADDKSNLEQVLAELDNLSDPKDAQFLQGYFKTGPGGYGEGDTFRGIRVPVLRQVARRYSDLAIAQALLSSKFHEDRLVALLMLVALFKKADEKGRKEIYQFYLENTRSINKWDLVDTSAGLIVGAYLQNKSRRPLYALANSSDLWERRIAIMATSHFIRNRDFADTFKIAEMLLDDRHDLIHKAVGWMLREVGNRDLASEEAFLLKFYKRMPRTMLRYAIEKFPEEKRLAYLKGAI
jgi:3-methyladenine DNA glycosylase AlkD